MASSTTAPLAPAQQKFLQRLLASHVLTDDQAHQVWESYNGDNDDVDSSSLPLATINDQLRVGFGLEIGSIKLHGTKYHTVINQHAENNTYIVESMTDYSPHERAYIRAVLERFVGADNDDDEAVTRMDLINLRTTIPKPYQMPSVDQTTRILDRLVDEYWLMRRDGDTIVLGSSEKRRQSRMSESYELGPRTYLELSSLLIDLGLPKAELPQFLFHRT